ncbi:MAG: hypothetical protein R3A45_05820 [Bdellovibrionota bacterium]
MCLQAPIAQASLVFKMSPKEMTKVAKEVRMGEVVSTWTSPHPVNKMIYTYVKIRVNQTFKGQERSEILLRQPGGTYTYPENKQTYRQKVFGMQTFEKGEKGIFFIDYDKDGAPNVMFQGKHKILRDPTTDQEQAYESFSRDVKYVDQELQPVQSKHSMFAKQEVRNLGALIDEINQAVEEERKGQHP